MAYSIKCSVSVYSRDYVIISVIFIYLQRKRVWIATINISVTLNTPIKRSTPQVDSLCQMSQADVLSLVMDLTVAEDLVSAGKVSLCHWLCS